MDVHNDICDSKAFERMLIGCTCGINHGNRHLHDYNYRQTSKISRTWVGNKIADHSDVVGASPVGAAPTTSSFST